MGVVVVLNSTKSFISQNKKCPAIIATVGNPKKNMACFILILPSASLSSIPLPVISFCII